MHPALRRLLADFTPPVGQVTARVSEATIRMCDSTTMEKAIRSNLARELSRFIIESERGVFKQTPRPGSGEIECRFTLHALTPQELDTLLIAAFEAGRRNPR